jgi:hypothetical protein
MSRIMRGLQRRNIDKCHVRTEDGTYRRDEKRKTLYISVVGSTLGLMRIRIHHFRSTRIRIQVFSSPTCKILQLHFFISLELYEATEAFSLKREHLALPNMKFLNFFLFLWVKFCLPGSGYSRPNSMLIHEDPDPQHYCM